MLADTGGLGAALANGLGPLGIAALILAIPATGKLCLDVLGVRTDSRALALGFAVALGFCLVMLALYAPLALTGRVVFWPTAALLTAGLFYAPIAAWRRRRGAALAVDRAAITGALVVFALLCSFADRAPFWGYDAKGIYGLKAKVLLYERNLAGPAFQDVDVVHYHADYPLGLPLVMAFAGWVAEGAPADPRGLEPAADALEWVERHDAVNAYGAVAALWVLGILAVLYHLARARFGPGRGAFLALFVGTPLALAFPWLAGRSWSWEGADVPMALCLGVAGIAALRALDGLRAPPSARVPQTERPGRLLGVAAIAAAGSLTLKFDAVIGLASLALVLLFGARPRVSVRPLAALVGGAAAAILIVTTVSATTAGSPFDEQYGAALLASGPREVLARVPEFASATWEVLDSKSMLAYWLFVLLVGVPLGFRAGGRARLVAVWLCAHLGACTFVFLITPNDVTWHVSTALPRLWCQLGIPAGWLAIAACAQVWPTTTDGVLLPRAGRLEAARSAPTRARPLAEAAEPAGTRA